MALKSKNQLHALHDLRQKHQKEITMPDARESSTVLIGQN
jgi:hypothetical protein